MKHTKYPGGYHKLQIFYIENNGPLKPYFILISKPDTYKSWAKAQNALYGFGKFKFKRRYKIIGESKDCRIFQYDPNSFYFIVNIKFLTVKQAIATTKIGCVILMHNS